MFIRPGGDDLKLIGFYLGKVVLGIGLVMVPPLLLGVALGEWNSVTAFVIAICACTLTWAGTDRFLSSRRPLTWAHGTVTVALAWLVGSIYAAVPISLSAHVFGYLDAVFEAMSGLTTTGLSMINDIDHLPRSVNLYRHLLHFAGGQGIVIVVLSLFASGGARIGTLYASEGRDERILPNFIRTARFIFLVAGTYLVIGTAALFVALLGAGFDLRGAAWHAVNLFLAAFDTGGFATQSQSILYYHSATVELVTLVLMLAGTVSFGLHLSLWRGDRRELLRHVEARSFAVTIGGTALLLLYGLTSSGVYEDAPALFRRGIFTLVSAHTGSGFNPLPEGLLVSDWGVLAPAAIVVAMGLGGMASSTSGGIKAIRVAITAKALLHDVRRLLLPESALVVTTYHARQRRVILRDDVVRGAVTILLLYVLTYLGGALVALLYGTWDVTEAIFESVSAAGNAGLSVGITHPDMPRALQLTYLLQMWLGRLEFVAVFALFGYSVSLVRGRS